MKSRAGRVWLGLAAAAAVLAGLVAGPANAADAGPPPGSFIIQNYQTKQCATAVKDPVKGFYVRGGACDTSEEAPYPNDPIWIFGSGNSIRSYMAEEREKSSGIHYCLDATGRPDSADEGSVGINACNGGLHQKWTRYEGGYVKNWATKQCLDIKSERLNVLYTRACMHHDWQKWAFKPL
ncbi:ricin-type beta-trefoil lectin domain protein [Streptomyces zaomyceticus]|uniref:ricin-type beta-trefoil lectin domain protein n=1 Tax=Streptomyces zaomyceticus TaxID=68286 RepID=UPI00369F35CD